jgi:glucose/arabinose dehydrogenase
VPDPEFGKSGACEKYVPPVQRLGPHVAGLGLKFYTGTQFPPEYRGQLFIPEHGSWNRSEPIGYRITHVRLDGNRAVGYEPFATGWLRPDGTPSGRPVDLLVLQDGSMLVSDDHAGAIYRITYAASRAGG